MAARFANKNQEIDYQANVTPAGKAAFEAARAKNSKLTYAQWAASAKHNKSFYRLGGGAPATGAPGSGKPGDPGVPAGLTPEQMGEKINVDYDIAERLTAAEQDYLDVADPSIVAAKRAQIVEAYNRGVGDVGENLTGRGLTGAGLTADQLWDVNRARDLATAAHEDQIRRATERWAALKTNLDTRKTNSDLNFAALAGSNVRAPVAAVPGQAGYTGPAKPKAPAKPAAPAKPKPSYSPGDTTYRGPAKPGGKSTVYKGKDWSKVAQLFPASQFNILPMPKGR